MTFSQQQLKNSKNKIEYVLNLLKLALDGFTATGRRDGKTNWLYFYRSYIKFESVCPVCAEPYNGRLRWGSEWCRHEEAGGGMVKVIGQKMAKSEWDAKSEALLDYDTEQAMVRGDIRNARDLQVFAKENGWNQPHEQTLIKKIQQKHRLR